MTRLLILSCCLSMTGCGKDPNSKYEIGDVLCLKRNPGVVVQIVGYAGSGPTYHVKPHDRLNSVYMKEFEMHECEREVEK